MPLFYRVESKDGYGVYQHFLASRVHQDYSNDRCPPPDKDNLPIVRGEHRFGFSSIKQFRDWFPRYDLKKIVRTAQESGVEMFLSVYDAASLASGNKQAIAPIDNLKLIKKTTLSKLFP
jgi:hypothetical protein